MNDRVPTLGMAANERGNRSHHFDSHPSCSWQFVSAARYFGFAEVFRKGDHATRRARRHALVRREVELRAPW